MGKGYKQLIWLGAGKAVKPNIRFEDFECCTLIDADKNSCIRLAETFKENKFTIKHLLISSTGGQKEFCNYNLTSLSALSKEKQLRYLFPGLTLKGIEERKSVGIVSLIDSLNLTGRGNWLIVDTMDCCLGLLMKMQENGQLSKFEKLILLYSEQPLYEDMPSFSELRNYLDKSAFDIVHIDENDPDFLVIEFEKNLQYELITDLKLQNEKISREHENLKEVVNLKINKLEKQIKTSFENLTKTVKFLSSSTAKQIESSLAIQRYLESGEKSLNFHGWPISADLGAYLVNFIDNNNYDAIIEFGSGTSTLLMAKTVIAKHKFLNKHDNSIEKPNILSFDHNKKYFEKTKENLENEGLIDLVNLVHAPLIEYSYNERNFSFYDCNEALQDLASKLKRKCSSLLVLIDGPPEATNDHARFPAFTHLLKHLKGHRFTILLDDYDRKQEKEAVKEWIQIAEQASVLHGLETIKSEKGLAILNIQSKASTF